MSSMRLGFKSGGYQNISDIQVPDFFNNRLRTGVDAVDTMFGGPGADKGFLPSSVIALHGDPGTGKTTFLLQVLHHLSKNGNKCAYVSTEESKYMLKRTCDRIGVKYGQIDNVSSLETIIRDMSDFDVMMIDSIAGVMSTGTRKTGLALQEHCINKICEAAKKKMTTVFINVHNTKTGKIKGSTHLTHTVDIVCELAISQESEGLVDKDIEFKMSKNRFGPTETKQLLRCATGYDFGSVKDTPMLTSSKQPKAAKKRTKKQKPVASSFDMQVKEIKSMVEQIASGQFSIKDIVQKCPSIVAPWQANYVVDKMKKLNLAERVAVAGSGNARYYRFVD